MTVPAGPGTPDETPAPGAARRPWRALPQLVAATVLLLAGLLGLARLALPHIDHYRGGVEALVGDALGQTVRIERISADWQGWLPWITLDGVELLERPAGPILLSAERLRVGIDLWASLRARAMAPALLQLYGLELDLIRRPDGRIELAGLSPDGTDGHRIEALAGWLQAQREVVLLDTRLGWLDEQGELGRSELSAIQLRWRNAGDRHEILGTGRLPAELGGRLDFGIRWQGDLLDRNWSGEIYLAAGAVAATPMLARQPWLRTAGARGRADLQLWTAWRDARLERATARLRTGVIQLPATGDSPGVSLPAVDAMAFLQRRAPSLWRAALVPTATGQAAGGRPERLLIELRGRSPLAPEALQAGLSGLSLQAALPLVQRLRALPAHWRDALLAMAPGARLRQLHLDWRSPRRWRMQGGFDGLSNRPWGALPGQQGASGWLMAEPDKGQLRLDSPALRLQGTERCTGGVDLGAVTGRMDWRREGEGWMLSTRGLQARGPTLSLALAGRLALTPGQAPEVDLAGRIARARLAPLGGCLPERLAGSTAGRWLRDKVEGGLLRDGVLLLRGRLDAFPFRQREGRLDFRALIEQGLLAYAPGWPRMEEIEAELRMENATLEVRASSARLMGVEVGDGLARVDDLLDPTGWAELSGRSRLGLKNARAFIAETPLAGRIGPRLSSVELEGSAAVRLALRVPLRRGPPVGVDGEVRIENQRLGAIHGPVLEQATGLIAFDRGGWSVDITDARYEGLRVRARADFRLDRPGLRTLELAGRIDADTLRARLAAWTPSLSDWLVEHGLTSHVAGATDWQAELRLSEPLPGQPSKLVAMALQSSLEGLALTLPPPLGKPAAEPRALSIKLSLDDGAPGGARIALDGLLEARLRLAGRATGAAPTPVAASVHLGGGSAPAPGAGVQISGQLPELALTPWLRFLADTHALPGRRAGRQAAPALRAALGFGRLQLAGQTLHEVELRLAGAEAAWQLDLQARELAGRVRIPFAPDAPVQAEFEHLALQRPGAGGPEAGPMDPRALPPVDLHVERLALGALNFTEARLRSRPSAEGVRLEALSLQAPGVRFEGSGTWRTAGSMQRSRLDITAHSETLQQLLASLGFQEKAVEGGQSTVMLQADWPGGPTGFALQRLSGNLALKVESGRLLDLDPGQGRLFGLLSLRALPRRLALDFSDVFDEGFGFDRIEGRFQLEDGNAYTQDTVMEGPAARIGISGRTGLVRKDYDQVATVLPKVSSALPMASALFGPVGAAVGGALLIGQEVFKQLPLTFDSLLERRYSITGSWSEPVIERLRGEEAGSTADGGPG